MEEPDKRLDELDVEKHPKTPQKSTHKQPRPRSRFTRLVGTVALCVVSSAATAWLLLGTGIIKPDATNTITQNRQSIVLQQGEIVAEVFKKVSPSTVAITTESQVSTQRQLFAQQGDSTIEQGAGSGIIISADGYVMTNRHVIPDGTSKVTVVLADGMTYSDVRVIGRDPLNDIAFLKINGVKNLPAAELGDSNNVQPGQQVVAIGNALGEFRNSVTSGIISGKGRPIQAADESGSSEQLDNLLQTDAAINPGNSGGPLVTLEGKVIGINTAVSQDGQAIGFAIPIDDAKGLVNSVLKNGKIVRAYLGVRFVNLDKTTAEQFNLTTYQGAYVVGNRNQPAVIQGSPADKAGLRQGDIITKVNNTQISETQSMPSLLAQFAPGDKVSLSVLRDGKTQTIAVTLEEYPS